MAKKRYSRTFKASAVKQVQDGARATDVARECGASVYSIREWVQKADAGGSEGPPTDKERVEIKRLRRELREARQERDILKKATAYFAKEQL